MNINLNETNFLGDMAVNNPVPPTEPIMAVSKLNIPFLIIMFIIAVGIHALIGYLLTKVKKDIAEKGNTIERSKQYKTLNLLFKWYPAGAVVVLILILYF